MDEPYALVVEDDYDLSVIFAQAVRSAGFTVEVARTGDAAMEMLKSTVPDVVVLDLHLPGVAGMDILKAIKSDSRLSGTHVIVATADDRLAETLHDDADLVLVKPVSFGQLKNLSARFKD